MSQADIEALMQQQDWDGVEAAAILSLQQNPCNPRIHAYLGLCLFQKQDWAAAEAEFQKATALQPDFWEAGAKLAQCYERQHMYSEALIVAKEFHHVQPNDHTLAGLIEYLEPMVHDRVDGWERTAQLGYQVTLAGDHD
ncbi:hypothetical protein BH11ARM1_BH11ARM1_16820 [soil metagenome]